jgi:hypothetical protein
MFFLSEAKSSFLYSFKFFLSTLAKKSRMIETKILQTLGWFLHLKAITAINSILIIKFTEGCEKYLLTD